MHSPSRLKLRVFSYLLGATSGSHLLSRCLFNSLHGPLAPTDSNRPQDWVTRRCVIGESNSASLLEGAGRKIATPGAMELPKLLAELVRLKR